MGAFYTVNSLLLARKSAFCYVINAICYAIGRRRRDCYLPALKIQQRCYKSASYFQMFSTTEKSAFTSGGHSSTGPYLFLGSVHTGGYSNGLLIKIGRQNEHIR